MLWYEHQVQVKRSMHGSGPRLANADVVTHATPSVVRAQTTAWERANPQYFKHITATESFTGGVPKKMIGGKAFWYKSTPTATCASGVETTDHKQRITTRPRI